jgi:branched-chain amino acid transport system permease protein
VSALGNLLVAGSAVGLRYALVVLGFVVIYRATGVINFAQGSFLVLGAYLAHNAVATWGLNFYLAIPIAMAICAAIGVLIELLILRHMVGEPVISVIMVTIGLFIVLQEVPTAIWSPQEFVGDPWGADSKRLGDVIVETRNIATLALAAGVLLAFFVLFRYTKAGLATRVTALDQEAALAQGISVRRVVAFSWAIAGAVGALAGITAAAGPSPSVTPALGLLALIAFPAMILGGLDSAGGAVIGGLIIGVTQSLTTGWAAGTLHFGWLPTYPDVLGKGFDQVTPYLVMIIILLIRPFGLFGTKEVRRL